MFYLAYFTFWFSCILSSFSFDTEIAEYIYMHTLEIYAFLILVMLHKYLSCESQKYGNTISVIIIFIIYSVICDLIGGEISSSYYALEIFLFSWWSMWVLLRPDFNTAKTIDTNNIILAFYKGDKGSFIMKLFQLFGLPVKSLTIISGENCLTLKKQNKCFLIKNSRYILQKRKDYILIDTGVQSNEDFNKKLMSYKGIPVKKFGLRIRCVEGVKDLLQDIGKEWKPGIFDNIPSVYLRKCLKA